MKKPVALVLIALTLFASQAHAEPVWIKRFWQRVESIFHPNKPEAPQTPPEKIGPLSEPETERTQSAAFVRAVVATKRYTQMLKQDHRVIKLLNTDPALALQLQPADYRSHVQNGPSLGFLFGAATGVSEGYSVAQHTVRVLEIYQEQKKFYGLNQLRLNADNRRIDTLMKWTLLFHDIGKSFAAQAGDKGHETIYSVPIATDLMKTAGFNPAEVRVAAALIWSHQILGSYVRDMIAPDTVNDEDPTQSALHAIRMSAEHAGIEKHEFFKLMKLVMTADAASYPFLHDKVFTTEANGQLISTSADKLDQLENQL